MKKYKRMVSMKRRKKRLTEREQRILSEMNRYQRETYFSLSGKEQKELLEKYKTTQNTTKDKKKKLKQKKESQEKASIKNSNQKLDDEGKMKPSVKQKETSYPPQHTDAKSSESPSHFESMHHTMRKAAVMQKNQVESMSQSNSSNQSTTGSHSADEIIHHFKKAIGMVKKLVPTGSFLLVAVVPIALVFVVLITTFVVILSGAGAGGASSSEESYQCQVTPEVEKLRDQVEEACEKYEIDEYVDLVLAIIQQESGGKGTDVMQCEASGFNEKPPIDSVKESIDVGVHTFSDCLKRAECKSSDDVSKISLALQGYNFGNGYIEWAKKVDRKYTAENAKLFSENMKKALHVSTYGDVDYVPHVLQYYVKNDISDVEDATAKDLIKELKENNTASAKAWSIIEKGATLVGKVTYGMIDPPRQDDGRDKPTVLDCSSFAAWCFHKNGFTSISYQSTTATFCNSTKFSDVSADDLKVGDIGLKGKSLPTGGSNHIGIYCGKRKNGMKVWMHCTSQNDYPITKNKTGVLFSTYSNFTYFRRLKKLA